MLRKLIPDLVVEEKISFTVHDILNGGVLYNMVIAVEPLVMCESNK